MRRAALVLVFALTACKSMGSVGSGLGHVASGVGHVASAAGHVANVAGRVAAPVAQAAAPVATAVVKAAPTATNIALETAAAMSADNPPPPLFMEASDHEELRQDLCLDCPDAGNCASCPADRHRTY
jgi:hypothetical protein